MAARILVVEDNPDNMSLMVYLLRAHGYEPLQAVNGAEGVRAAAEALPDLILLDLRMPEMEGYEAVGLIRRLPRARKDAGGGGDGLRDDRRSRANRRGRIRRLHREAHHRRGVRGPGRGVPARGVASRAGADGGAVVTSVLVLDDRQDDRDLLSTVLGYAGYTVLEASTGQTALDLARTEQPDLIITDILMPTMNGYEFVRELRSRSSRREHPGRLLHGQLRRGRDPAARRRVWRVALPGQALRARGDHSRGGGGPRLRAGSGGDTGAHQQFDRNVLRALNEKLVDKVKELGNGQRRAGTARARERNDPELSRRWDLPGGSRGPDHLCEPGGGRAPRLPRRGPARPRRPRARAPLPSRPDPVADRSSAGSRPAFAARSIT